MSNTDSSAIVRLIQIAQQEPIFEAPAVNDTLPTELVEMDELERPARSYRGYFLTALVAVAIGVAGAFYVVDRGSAATASAKDGLAGVIGSDRQASAPAPVVEPVVTPAAAAVPTLAVSPAAAAAPALADSTAAEAAPAEAAPPPALADSTAAEAAPAEAAPPPETTPVVAAPAPPNEAVEKQASTKKASTKTPSKRKARRKAERKAKSKKQVAVADGKGTLMISAKPPCRIYIDGRDTKLTSPQRSISLEPGKHKVSLVNREYGIKTTATVVIKAGKRTKMIKDMSSRIK